jgi:hypothetical protein
MKHIHLKLAAADAADVAAMAAIAVFPAAAF